MPLDGDGIRGDLDSNIFACLHRGNYLRLQSSIFIGHVEPTIAAITILVDIVNPEKILSICCGITEVIKGCDPG